ncbi:MULTISPECIES: SET domain-containing protein-lysine N-methyltransferase [Vibrio]|uniref:SET domain-containing protein n=3 Tax=Vibrio TaxID=662 RepID=A0AB38NIX7_9VIBR|nr:MULTISPECIES: SET domain-containing protein-lysine N-methyltransferase [Vibrio]TKG27860.1 SET domain-containing protein [Vibrio tasmaniensis]TKG39200.1 SET domain-containing protein [Vibrio tasmaniensis]TKG45527.1 SET domain-containing protein [Vibrio tasmaniensis]TKG46475.1 SET domain-containing protein [Vibrio tasmaniensis]TKG50941.1 SET domain-containing protein [Vibrio tasmaniensis]
MNTNICHIYKNEQLVDSAKICVNWVKGKGRAVIAKTNINKFELIEMSPTSEIPAAQIKLINNTDVFEHYFVNPECYLKTNSNTNEVGGYISFGLVSLCNHSKSPNAIVKWLHDEMGTWAELVALEAIKEGEEIEICYTNIDEYSNVDSFI